MTPDEIGGGARTSELTTPGLKHDTCSAVHPFGADGYRWRAVFEPLVRHFDDILPDALGPLVRVPDHPIALLRLGTRAPRLVVRGDDADRGRPPPRLVGAVIVTGTRVTSLGDLPQAPLVMFDTSPAAFKLDLAVQEGIPCISRDARRGVMPSLPFMLIGQQYLADPGRSVGDIHPVWTYAHVPHGYTGDATSAMLEQIERHAPGFRERVVATHVTTPHDPQARNPTTSAATSSADSTICGVCSPDRSSRSTTTPPASPGCTCARPRRLPGRARTGCAVSGGPPGAGAPRMNERASATVTDPQTLVLRRPHLDVTALSWGPTDGRLVLCLHGFPDSAWGWRKMAPILAEQGLRVVAPFSRGYAPTGPAADGDYHIGALMYDALAVHQELGAPADAVLIGHDWGAITSNAIAAHPDSPFAEHISMALPPVAALSRTRGRIGRQLRMLPRQVRNSWYILFFQLPVLPERLLPRIIPRLWHDWGPPGYSTEAELHDALIALASPAHRRAAVGYYRALVRPQRPAPLYAELNRWRFALPRVPILHLQGAQDGAMMAPYADQITRVLPPGSRLLTVPSAGHFLQIEQPRIVADAILAHLGSR